MLREMLACCKLYISETRNAAALESIERASKLFPEAPIINKFQDESYNRVGYTLVSRFPPDPSGPSSLRNAVFSMVEAALDAIDLELHSGTHPRLGVVDHICFHPLSQASLDQTAHLAKYVAADIGHKLRVLTFLYGAAHEQGRTLDLIQRGVTSRPMPLETNGQRAVPTFLYGAAHEQGRTLDSIRRELGYFKPNAIGNQWSGGPQPKSLQLKPDAGPSQATQSTGLRDG
ncbi:uncharacterized protein LOC131234579 isoform X3 [Magnolia sinica]|uniref:uncharacterized protein LOC131234579 isoform X3 n=1 Tax=Magnolia sinica TaxID=86752 RepID=UPI002659E84A|nr:uncharacterized protein LOC131234579 isoform X3 [Magnolia sinica]